VTARNPDFVFIGAQKAGTSWLHACFRSHPDIDMAPYEMYSWRDWGIDITRRYFGRSTFPLVGEKGPDYLILPPRAVRKMCTDLPSTQFIVLLRRPDGRAWSQARMEASGYNSTSTPSFARLYANVFSPRNIRRTRYDRTLRPWLECAHDRIHIFFYEDLRKRPDWLLH